MNTQWSHKRKISLAIHILYLSVTFFSGLGASLLLWQSWFSALDQSWLAAALVVGTLETLAVTSLVLHIARIEWPLTPLRHALPFFSIIPLGYELFLSLSATNPWLAGCIATFLAAWFVFLSFRLLHSLEGLFIDSIEAAREQAKEEMGRVATTLARYQETKLAAESFARSILPPPEELLDVTPAPASNVQKLLVSDTADPRMEKIVRMASVKDDQGQWLLTLEQVVDVTGLESRIVTPIVTLVRSNHLKVLS